MNLCIHWPCQWKMFRIRMAPQSLYKTERTDIGRISPCAGLPWSFVWDVNLHRRFISQRPQLSILQLQRWCLRPWIEMYPDLWQCHGTSLDMQCRSLVEYLRAWVWQIRKLAKTRILTLGDELINFWIGSNVYAIFLFDSLASLDKNVSEPCKNLFGGSVTITSKSQFPSLHLFLSVDCMKLIQSFIHSVLGFFQLVFGREFMRIPCEGWKRRTSSPHALCHVFPETDKVTARGSPSSDNWVFVVPWF